MLKLSILSIGDEICIGQVVNTNSAYISQRCTLIGCYIVSHKVIRDEKKHIVSAINDLFGTSDIIISTGGLGPTSDDITKQTLTEYFEDELILYDDIYKKLEERFAKRGIDFNKLNQSQAYLPKNAIIIPNELGSASGMHFKKAEKELIALPGVPAEMKSMLESYVLNYLQKKIQEKGQNITLYKVIQTTGIAESMLAEKIGSPESIVDKGNLAYLPSYYGVKLRISQEGNSYEEAQNKIEDSIKKLRAKIGEYIFAEDDIPLINVVTELLKKHKKTISVAESCTAGKLGAVFTDLPGSSAYFIGGIIAYNNSIKEKFLDIPTEILNKHGAVSSEVAELMAKNVREKFNTDYGISITGIAGPEGGTPEKPVGTVWIGLADKESTITKKFMFTGNRENNRERSVASAITIFYELLKHSLL